VEPPALGSAAGLAARLAARGVRPRRVSAKRSWPPGCGRIPAPPPPAPPAADEVVAPASVQPVVQNGAPPPLGRDEEVEEAAASAVVSSAAQNAVAPASVPPVAQNGAPPPLGWDEEVEAAAAPAVVSSVAQNGALPQQRQDEVAVAPAAVSSAPQNGALPLQGQNKAAEVVASLAVSAVERSSVLQHALPQEGTEQVDEEGDRGENSEIRSSASLDGQEGNRTAQMAAPMVAVQESSIPGASSFAQNGGDGSGLLVVEKGQGSSGDAMKDGAAGVADVREIGNRPGEGVLERKVDGVEGTRKRWLTSALNPPPKRRVVSAVRTFPPGCGRAAVTTDSTEVLEVSPIRTYPPGRGRAAVTTIGSGDEVRMPSGATPVARGNASPTEALAVLPDSGGVTNEKVEGKRVVDEGSSKSYNKIQESRVASDTSLVGFVRAKQANDHLSKLVPKASPKHGFREKMKGGISPHEGKQVAGGNKVRSKLDGSSQKDISKTPMRHAIHANTKGKRSDGDKMNATLLDNAKASKERNMQKKTSSAKKDLLPSNAIMKEHKFASNPKGDGTRKNTLQQSSQVEENGDMDLVPNQIIVQALKAPDKCPWTQGSKSIFNASKSLVPRKKLKGKDSPPRKLLQCKDANDDTMDMDDNDDSNIKDDRNSRALVVYEGKKEKREFSINLPPSVPSGSHHGQSGDGDIDARRKVRKLLQRFQGVCRKLMQAEEQHIRKITRIDLEAINVLKKNPMYTKLGPVVGNVPGVEVGDEFHFRVELSLVGLHRPYQAGIDTSKVNGVLVAISIVASGGYPDELSSSDELIYTGSGGKAAGKKEAEDQKLERGNLALKSCIETKTPVRVIHGFKGQSRGEVSHSKGKQISTFTYDGLYNVVEYWQESLNGSIVFKFKLQRIPGQPQLALHVVKGAKKSKVREGLLLSDISDGAERIPICVINTIDSSSPASFKYVTKIIYPPWYKKEPPKGCNCTNGCSDSEKCACAVKNGGEIPYNFNGAIVEAKTLVYECGPSCR
jgi:[histone H3]-lysine9 N-trimethyltransferase EHMT